MSDLAVTVDPEWESLTDDELPEGIGVLLHDACERAARQSANSITMSRHDKHDDRVIGIALIAFIGPYEVGVHVNPAPTATAVWVWRHAPLRCEGCRERVDEDDHKTDVEGVVLCDECYDEALLVGAEDSR